MEGQVSAGEPAGGVVYIGRIHQVGHWVAQQPPVEARQYGGT